jgi:putative membrane protein
MAMEFNFSVFLSTVIYAALGMLMFGISFWICTRLSPFSIRKEIEEDQNVALAILMASMFLGIAIIIAASLTG